MNGRSRRSSRPANPAGCIASASAITASDPDAKGAFFESPQGKDYRHATYYTASEEVPHL